MLVALLLGGASNIFGTIVITFKGALVMVAAMKWLEGRGL
jgi:ABC-type branched-subunit amino acid transport system permease subunit